MIDNVSFTEESYVPTGFGAEDYLIPNKPTIDWFTEPTQSGGVSFAGGLSNMSGNQQSVAGGLADIDPNAFMPMRKRRGIDTLSVMRAADVANMMAGNEGSYLGQTLDRALAEEKKLAEEDPEGKAADLNRAKLLSQKAYATDDPELKKKYGAAIKRLLPKETQGLDDLTASEFFVSSEKMDIEKLKAATALKKEEIKGEYGLQKQGLSNEGKLDLQTLKNAARSEHDALQYDLELAKKDKDYEKAVMIRDRMDALKQFEKEADYALESMKQDKITGREQYKADVGYDKAVDVANINAASRENVARLGAESRENVANINANSREGIAKLQAASREAVANINALSRQQAAQLKASAAATAAGTNEIGDVLPSEGVVSAIKMIENNPNQFDELANWYDSGLGRFFGLITEKTVQNRSQALMALQETVTGSVMNLMKLFPKGGASVINSGTEQKRFAPIAEIIASGRGNKIVPAVKAYYGGLYDAAQKVAGEKAPISREQYVNLMVYGNTGGKNGGGLSMISRDTMGMTAEGLPAINRTQANEGGASQPSQSQYKKEGRRVF